MERLNKGEKYWFISGLFTVEARCEAHSIMDAELLKVNNYFPASEYTPKMVDEIAKKLRAVLNGADVIDMPSEEECETFAVELAREEAFVCETFSTRADWRMSSRMTVDWLKTKIVK